MLCIGSPCLIEIHRFNVALHLSWQCLLGTSAHDDVKAWTESHMLTCLPLLSCQPAQLLPSRLYLILYLWANSLPMPSAWRPWVPTSVMKCSDRRSTWRYSLRPSGSDMMSGHQAPSPSPLSKSSLMRKEKNTRWDTEEKGKEFRKKGRKYLSKNRKIVERNKWGGMW